jgi:hypothetical protein
MKFKTLLGTTAMAASLVLTGLAVTAGSASAGDTVTNATFAPGSVTVKLADGRNVVDGMLLLTGDYNGTIKTLKGYCVDIYHDMTIGTVNLAYTGGHVLTDSSGSQSGTGNPLSTITKEEVSGLWLLGTSTLDPSKRDAVQDVIWNIMNPTDQVVSAPAPVMAYISSISGNIPLGPVLADAIYPVGLGQGFVVGVPEPATWALMLIGVGGMGAALRRRRVASPSFA